MIKNNTSIQELIDEYSQDRQSWEKERQDYIIKCDRFEHIMEDQKNQLGKYELDKTNYMENVKKQVSKYIDDNFK